MKTVASTRADKNLIEGKADYQERKRLKKVEQRIKFYKGKIELEKKSAIDCIKIDWFDLAITRLNRIKDLQIKINES